MGMSTIREYDKRLKAWVVTSEPVCDACLVPYSEHLGLVGTCRELQAAKARIEELESKSLTETEL